MRIIAGSARGRRFEAPRGTATRPTPDRVREALFSILFGEIQDARILDLFAGTGALGLEALSRGAAFTTFVEVDAAAAALVQKNATALGFAARSEVLSVGAARAIAALAKRGSPYGLVFLDPPYDAGLLEPTLAQLTKAGILLPSALVVCEHHTKSEPPQGPGLEQVDHRTYGDVALAFMRPTKGSP